MRLENVSNPSLVDRRTANVAQEASSNRVFKSYDDIVDHCCYAWNTLVDRPWKMSIGLRQPVGTWVLINETWYKANVITALREGHRGRAANAGRGSGNDHDR